MHASIDPLFNTSVNYNRYTRCNECFMQKSEALHIWFMPKHVLIDYLHAKCVCTCMSAEDEILHGQTLFCTAGSGHMRLRSK